jgi:hypothetical protein
MSFSAESAVRAATQTGKVRPLSDHPKEVGDRSTLAIVHALRLCGYETFLPFGENTRCDLVIDDHVRLRRVQCKTGRLRNGAIVFNTASTCGHHRNPTAVRRDYREDVDCFAVFCPDTGSVYLIPIEDLEPRTTALLRVDPARNGQKRGIRLASRYELARVTIAVRGALAARAGGSGSCA